MLTKEAIRLFERYRDEIVIRYTFCPFAKEKLSWPQTVQVVETKSAREIPSLLPENADKLVLLLFPREARDWKSFRKDVSLAGGELNHFALAAFHPRPKIDDSAPHRLVPFLRSSPDPMVQCTPVSWLDNFAGGSSFFSGNILDLLNEPPPKSVAETIAQNNFKQVRSKGLANVKEKVESIIVERNETYARLDGTLPLW